MKRFAIAASITAALVLSSAALAGATLVGKYTANVASPAALKGIWTLTFAKAGTYAVADQGHIVIRGKYATVGSKVSLGHETGPAACPTGAAYSWKRSGKTLKLTRIKDTCAGRATVLAHTFTQSG
jgi:hypothetical protein